MINDGLKNETLTKELLSKGSSVITTRNDFGVHVFSGSLDDGIVSGRLGRPKYNIDELQKTVNTIITELLPVQRPTPPPTVPLPVYNAALADIADRDTTIERLNVTSSNLQARISDLETENQSLDIEIDGARTLQSISDNQAQIANNRVVSTIQQLQFSIQKATQEAIQRASLQARNDVLLSENGSLREQLFGKTSQLQAGAKSSGTLFTVNPQPQTNTGEPPIRASQKFKRALGRSNAVNDEIKFVNGETLTIFNSSSDTIKISITKDPPDLTFRQDFNSLGRWYSIEPETIFDLPSKETKIIKLNTSGRKDWTGNEKTRNTDGRLIVTGRIVGNDEGGSETVTLVTRIRRYD